MFYQRIRDLEANYIGTLCSEGGGHGEDAVFIYKQIEEMNKFIEEHSSFLGKDMMSPTRDGSDGLLSSLSKDFLEKIVIPMVQGKATREQCTPDKVYHQLLAWCAQAIKEDKEEHQSTEELLKALYECEEKVHSEYLNATKTTSNKNKSSAAKPKLDENNRASQFKPVTLVMNRAARKEQDEEKKVQKREGILDRIRGRKAA